MDYYVSKSAGSILFRRPTKLHLGAGDHIPSSHWEALGADQRAEMIRTGSVEGFDDPDSVQLAEPQHEQPIAVGVGKDKFMPEARVQRGQRRDAALDELIRKQEQAEVDADRGGSQDGVVSVELPEGEDESDDYLESGNELTAEELDEIRRLEAEEED